MNKQHPVDDKQIESEFNLLLHPGTQFTMTTRGRIIDGAEFLDATSGWDGGAANMKPDVVAVLRAMQHLGPFPFHHHTIWNTGGMCLRVCLRMQPLVH